MFKKFLIIASKQDKAGVNITTALSQFRENPLLSSMKKDADSKPNFDFYLREEDITSDENLDREKISKYDFVIFASRHRSEKGGKTLSIHAPGNWKENNMGGEKGKVCPTSALFLKYTLEILNQHAKDLKDYQVTLECTHHGPLISKPCMFIEIGATEIEWNDRRAAFIVAKTIKDAIETFKENPFREIAVGIGGPHYCSNFNKLQLNSNVAFSHIIPQYALPLSEEMIKEAVAKTTEEIDFVVLDWKGIPGEAERKNIISILEKNYISWKKTSDVGK